MGVVDLVGGEQSLVHLPPSRVGDLRAEVNAAMQQVTFFWTAPGERRDHGTGLVFL